MSVKDLMMQYSEEEAKVVCDGLIWDIDREEVADYVKYYIRKLGTPYGQDPDHKNSIY